MGENEKKYIHEISKQSTYLQIGKKNSQKDREGDWNLNLD